jgi:hypothetical protein
MIWNQDPRGRHAAIDYQPPVWPLARDRITTHPDDRVPLD